MRGWIFVIGIFIVFRVGVVSLSFGVFGVFVRGVIIGISMWGGWVKVKGVMGKGVGKIWALLEVPKPGLTSIVVHSPGGETSPAPYRLIPSAYTFASD